MQMVNFGLAERHLKLPHSQMNEIPWSVLQKFKLLRFSSFFHEM